MKKTYIQPQTEIIEAAYGEPVMEWTSTKVTDDEISDDDFNAKENPFPDYGNGDQSRLGHRPNKKHIAHILSSIQRCGRFAVRTFAPLRWNQALSDRITQSDCTQETGQIYPNHKKRLGFKPKCFRKT